MTELNGNCFCDWAVRVCEETYKKINAGYIFVKSSLKMCIVEQTPWNFSMLFNALFEKQWL